MVRQLLRPPNWSFCILTQPVDPPIPTQVPLLQIKSLFHMGVIMSFKNIKTIMLLHLIKTQHRFPISLGIKYKMVITSYRTLHNVVSVYPPRLMSIHSSIHILAMHLLKCTCSFTPPVFNTCLSTNWKTSYHSPQRNINSKSASHAFTSRPIFIFK